MSRKWIRLAPGFSSVRSPLRFLLERIAKRVCPHIDTRLPRLIDQLFDGIALGPGCIYMAAHLWHCIANRQAPFRWRFLR